jgi:hypothetical protein
MAAATQTAPDQAFQHEVSTQETELKAKLPVDPGEMTQQNRDPQKVAQLAYFYWESRGCPHGSAEEDWFRAERDIYSDASAREV